MPCEWEMVRYGMRYERGACVFADPYGERLQLAWQRETDRPDLERLVSDLRAKEKDEDSAAETEPITCPDDWTGLIVRKGDACTIRAARYIAPHRTLVEAALLPGRAGAATPLNRTVTAPAATILESIRLLPASPFRRWEAFGIHVEVRTDLVLDGCHFLPGDVTLRFKGPRALPSLSIRRLAFPAVRIKEPLGDWLRKQLPARSRVLSRDTRTEDGPHPLARLRSRRSRGPFGFLLGLRIARQDVACLCPREKRVYHAVVETARRAGESLLRWHCECGALTDRCEWVSFPL